jgi:hypothetical protein
LYFFCFRRFVRTYFRICTTTLIAMPFRKTTARIYVGRKW